MGHRAKCILPWKHRPTCPLAITSIILCYPRPKENLLRLDDEDEDDDIVIGVDEELEPEREREPERENVDDTRLDVADKLDEGEDTVDDDDCVDEDDDSYDAVDEDDGLLVPVSEVSGYEGVNWLGKAENMIETANLHSSD